MTRTDWRDGARSRSVEIEPLGEGRYRVVVDGVPVELAAERLGDGRLKMTTAEGHSIAEVTASAKRRFVRLGTLEFVLELEPAGRVRAKGAAHGGLEAPMPGVVTRVLVSTGEKVEPGQPLIAIEAMKMEHLIRAPRAGRVSAVRANQGEMVAGGAALIELEPDDGPNA